MSASPEPSAPQSAFDFVQAIGPFGADEAALAGRAICIRLESLHRSGQAHGAVTSHHVVRQAGGGFNLAGPDAATLDQEAAFLAPERRLGKSPSAGADIYSVGVLLYFLVTGELPGGSGTRLRDARPDLPERFIHLVERAMATRPEDRVPDAEQVAVELSQMLCGSDLAAGGSAARRRWMAITIFAIGVTALALVWGLWLRDTIGTSETQLSKAGAVELTATFVETTDLHTARYFHSATVLSDGRILIAGGRQDGAIAATEIVSATGSLSAPSGNLLRARALHSATLLTDGTVLIAGGNRLGGGAERTAEIFDPATGTSRAIADMHAPRTGHTATILLNGLILIAGGDGGNGGIADAELFDPASETFTSIGPLSSPRGYHSATRLNDGRVLIVGGWDVPVGFLTSAEIFDPATQTFTPTASVRDRRGYHVSMLLADGRVLIAGGLTAAGMGTSSAEIFNPVTGAFALAGSMHSRRGGPAAALLPSGEVLVIGGYQPGIVASAEVYDPATNSFKLVSSPLHNARAFFTASTLADGRVLVAGGDTAAGPSVKAEIFKLSR